MLNEIPLITPQDIQMYRPMAELDEKRIAPFILETQRVELKQVLGDALHYDFLLNVNDSVTNPTKYANYQKLFRGATYTYNGYTLEYEGVVPMLVYFALARFFPNNDVNVTKYGNTTKLNEYSEHLDPQVAKNIYMEMRSVGNTFKDSTIQYLCNNQTLFPLFSNGVRDSSNRGGFKFIDL